MHMYVCITVRLMCPGTCIVVRPYSLCTCMYAVQTYVSMHMYVFMYCSAALCQCTCMYAVPLYYLCTCIAMWPYCPCTVRAISDPSEHLFTSTQVRIRDGVRVRVYIEFLMRFFQSILGAVRRGVVHGLNSAGSRTR